MQELRRQGESYEAIARTLDEAGTKPRYAATWNRVVVNRLRGSRTQKEVASLLEMPVTTLSTLENQEAVPRGSVLKRLADFYGVPLNYFYAAPSAEMKATDTA